MADPTENDIPENTTWGQHLREIRRDLSMLVQNQTRVMELLGRFAGELNELRTEVADMKAKNSAKLAQLSADLIHLESQNISRHGETLSIMSRLERAGIQRSPDYMTAGVAPMGFPGPLAPKGKGPF